jgi:hypothetical protein
MSIPKDQKLLVPVDLGAGVDESVADESLLNKALSRLENVVFNRRGKLSKRDGIQFLNNSRYDGTTRSKGLHLSPYREGVVVFSPDGVDAYSVQANSCYTVDASPGYSIEAFQLATAGSSPQQYQSVVCNGYIVCAYWNSSGADITCLVFDEASKVVIRGPDTVNSGGFSSSGHMRLVACGNTVHAIVLNSGTGTVTGNKINLYSSSTVNTGWEASISETDGSISGGSLPIMMDADSNGTNVYVAYPGVAGSQLFVKSYDESGASIASVDLGVTASRVALRCADDVWVARFNGSNVNVYVQNAATISTTMASGQAFAPTSSNANSMGLFAGKVNGTAVSVVFSDKNNGTTYRTMVISNSNAISGAFNVGTVPRWQAISTPFQIGSETNVVFRDADVTNGALQDHRVFAVGDLSVSSNTFCKLTGAWAIGSSYYDAVQTGGYANYSLPGQNVKVSDDGYFSGLFPRQKTVALQGTTSGIGFDFVKFSAMPEDHRVSTAQFADSVYISGGITSYFDGVFVEETCFIDTPHVVYANTATAGNVSGNVAYTCVYEHVDANGNISWSAPSDPEIVIAGNNKKVNVNVYSAIMTNKSDAGSSGEKNRIAIYRTVSAGSTYYRVTSLQDTGATQTYQDDTSDTALTSNAKLYMQPGIAGTSQARYCAPASRYMITHMDRLFCVAEDGITIWYSAPRVIGEVAWFNPIFTIPIEDGGRITGMCSFDNRLIVFKASSIFAIEGPGPPENGGNGTEFSPAYKLPVATGCVDHRSIVATDQGVFFKSGTGIEFLDRKLGTSWIGEKVRDLVDAYPIITSGSVDDDNKIVFTCLTEETDNTAGTGILLNYHSVTGAWTVDRVEGTNNTANTGFVSSAFHTDGTSNKLWLLDRAGNLYKQRSTADGSRYTDTNSVVRMALETGWVRSQESLSDRQRVWNVEATLKAKTNASVNCAFAYDYVNTFSTDVRIPHTNTGSSGVHVVKLQPATPQNMAVKFRLTETAPVDNASGGTGEGFEILGVAFEVAPKLGANDPASGKKG